MARKATKTASGRRKSVTKQTRAAARKSAPARKGTRKAAAKKRPAAAKKAKKANKAKTAKKAATRRPASKAAARKTTRQKTAARAAASRRTAPPAPRKKEPSRISAAATAVRGSVAKAAAAVAGVLPWGDREPDALEMLERDHRRFEDLLRQGEETSEEARGKRRELLDTLTRELNAHELMEEKVLYPALQSHPQARDAVLEGFQEHHVADVIVNELHQVATNDEQWGAKFKVLKENLEHHIQEEEGEMFRAARGIFSREELRELAQRMLEVRSR